MRKAIDQDTLQALIETGAAREFRATRGPGAWGATIVMVALLQLPHLPLWFELI